MAALMGVEVFAPGHWFPSNGPKEGVKLNLDFVRNLAKNTASKGIKAILKLGHSEKQIIKQTDGQPALGIADNFRMKGNKLIADFKDLPDIVFKAIKKKLFKSLSVELAKDKTGPFIKKIAILGADLPAVESLKDLQAYFSTGASNDKLNFVLSWDETESQWRYRVREPSDFQQDTFRTKDLEGVPGIQIITGRLKPDKVPEDGDPKSAVLQAYHFAKESWNLEQAKKWIAENTNFSEENKTISFKFSEPLFNEKFFTTPIKDEKMGDGKVEITGIDTKEHVKVLAKVTELQSELTQLKDAKTELLNFKKQVEDSDVAKVQTELEETKAKLTEIEVEKLQFSKKETEKDQKISELEVKMAVHEAKDKEIMFSIKKNDILEPYKADVKSGKLAPAIVDKLETHLDSQKVNFSEDTELTVPAALALEIGKAYTHGLPAGEQGDDMYNDPDNGSITFGNVSEKIAHEALKLQAKNASLDYKQASEMALELNPKLMTEYKDWIMKFSGQ